MKEVEKTDRIKSMLKASLADPAASTDDLTVFEAVGINTKPLLRKSGLFARARMGLDVLAAMADFANKRVRPIPLQQLHADKQLPVGGVFHADLQNADGHVNLNTLFYLPNTETELISKLNKNVIPEVSVGVRATKLLCSDCAWDYNGEDSTFANIFDCVCKNDHRLGGATDTHLKMHGLDDWLEMSLVGRGAADGATILSRPKQVLGADEARRTQLRGFEVSLLSLFASESDTLPPTTPRPNPQGTRPMSDYTDKYVTLNAEHAVVVHKLTTTEAANVQLKADLAASTTSLAASETALAAAKATDGAKSAEELKAANEFLGEMVKASFALTGKSADPVPELVSVKVAVLRDARASLSLVIPTGGRSHSAASGNGTEGAESAVNHTAFKRRA